MSRLRRLAAALLLLGLPACGLPIPGEVRSAGEVRAEGGEPPPFQVIAPGPQPGATAEDIVRGFLTAQGSPAEGNHAVARQFLAPGTEWDATQGAVIYRTRRFVQDADRDPLTFAVRFETTARISPDGAFSLDLEPTTENYEVAEMPSGEYRLTQVPPGLQLYRQDRDRSFSPYDVYFFGRAADGGTSSRLVPDRVFLPATAARGPALVASLLNGPTAPLQGAVDSALPFAARAVSVTAVDGVITVDLPEQARQLVPRERQRLAAQLSWTLLPTFSGLRLRAGGQSFDVDGAGPVHTLEDWAEYDPAGVPPDAPLYYVHEQVLRSLDGTLPRSEATMPGGIAVDEVAVSPAGASLGLLTRAEGADEVRVGRLTGPFGPPALRAPELASLSWGPGDQGLWVLSRARRPAVWLLPPPGRAGEPQEVLYEQPEGAGALSLLRVSRDGARVALVYGTGESRRLFVGTVVPAGDGLRITGVKRIAPSLDQVTDVAWQDGTTLAVLASSELVRPIVVWKVTVDGSTPPGVVQRPGLEGDAVALAAAPGRPLVVGTVFEGRPRLYQDNGTVFLEREPGTAPAYPG